MTASASSVLGSVVFFCSDKLILPCNNSSNHHAAICFDCIDDELDYNGGKTCPKAPRDFLGKILIEFRLYQHMEAVL